MICPYLADPLKRDAPVQGPSMRNVCYGYAAQSPYWNYTAVDVATQEDVCTYGNTHRSCPRYKAAKERMIEPPVAEPVAKGRGGWWPFGG